MKFDDHLAAFLYENKTLRLEGIGTLTLDGKVNVTRETDKEVYYPIEGLSFAYNAKSNTDDELIAFLVKRLGKIQPLVRSDLESYLSNIKQFVNIGKPYTIQGVGTLSKTNNGSYEFTPGSFLPAKEELHPRRENEEHNYPVRNESGAGKTVAVILIVIAAMAVLGGIAWGVSSLVSKNHETTQESVSEQGVVDTLPAEPKADTAKPATAATAQSIMPDSARPASHVAGDSARYKMVFEITASKKRADRRTYQLYKLHSYNRIDSIRTGTGVVYRMYVPMKLKMSDTTHVLDSFKIFYGGNILAERQ